MHTPAKSKGIFVHGDIKGVSLFVRHTCSRYQNNVLISKRGEAFLADFGLTRLYEVKDGSEITSLAAVGASRFKAPELLLDDASKKTPATDVWAFGMLIYQVGI